MRKINRSHQIRENRAEPALKYRENYASDEQAIEVSSMRNQIRI